ncbi:acetyl/propionyl/methylcrotonyl-CoA carboxylase subunit alpha [Sphingomonas sp. URHD0057]|uniref:acetyl/propionyl/methylcrotonyl-CoA carboxylase subunit alpha n=1 Tax=Sphingomonas sp. URHD0057 TaxID=1380389 RepID=UPI00048A6CA1|nr:acetyl/propionyl/methylcrotonyl-CoA carboxylase subunit alpha [Sphingomonas sp. URHD0057]
MIKSLLIANRGEIACRVIRTARRLGVRTVAVYSDADAKALHVRMADEAVHIGPSPARESYLVGDRIIEAAKASGAEAIHPGYGFLSENADFAQAVIDAGLIWVGPKPASIRAMGLKDAAKTLMAEAGVPVTPGYLGKDQSPKRLKKEADAIGYPVLIKAVAGGGGKGMRKVDRAADFDDALESCKREAASSFGNDIVLLEKWIESPRHIEVQVFGDSHGNVVHLFERDCSLQRRHQKVIEEAPAPGMDAETREAVCGAAVRAAQAVNYENAGTIEFIADASDGLKPDRIWFMEMNTRLQVEHPVTEEITGQDLVEWQLRVASGETLPKAQDELTITGHAIEARLYAEDPATGFLPSVGPLELFRIPYAPRRHGWYDEARGWRESGIIREEPVRIDTGYEEGDEVSPFYDPMIAKIIAHSQGHSPRDDRDFAWILLNKVLNEVQIWPVKQNAGFMANLLQTPAFVRGRVHTNFIEEHGEFDRLITEPDSIDSNVAAQALVKRFDQTGPLGFRVNAPMHNDVRMRADGKAISSSFEPQFSPTAEQYASVVEGHDGIYVSMFGTTFKFLVDEVRGTGTTHGAHDGEIEAPMPGKVTAVEVSNGEKVAKGQRLLTLEAMKMEHALTAPFDGTVAELNAVAGAQVTEGTVLAKVEPTSSPAQAGAQDSA